MSTALFLMSVLVGTSGSLLYGGADGLAPEGPARAAPRETLDVSIARDLERLGADDRDLRAVCDGARAIAQGCAYVDPLPAMESTELHTDLRWDRAGYFGFGLSPGATLQLNAYGGGNGFNPALRYDAEFGWAWRRPDGRRELRVGVHPQLTQYFGRWRPGGGADVVVRGSVGHVYLRGGLGAVGGLPRSRDVEDALPAIGGTIGLGLQGRRDEAYGRIGVDYDLRVNTNFEVVHTVLLVVRLEFAWF